MRYGQVALVCYMFIVAACFFRRARCTPRLFIILCVAYIAFYLVVCVWVDKLGLGGPLRSDAVRALAEATIVGSVWIPYFYFSKRVKGTFMK